jgi:hypothetical protein
LYRRPSRPQRKPTGFPFDKNAGYIQLPTRGEQFDIGSLLESHSSREPLEPPHIEGCVTVLIPIEVNLSTRVQNHSTPDPVEKKGSEPLKLARSLGLTIGRPRF